MNRWNAGSVLFVAVALSMGVMWRSVWLVRGVETSMTDVQTIRATLRAVADEDPFRHWKIQWYVVKRRGNAAASLDQPASDLLSERGLKVVRVDQWDDDAPIWLSAGKDQKPGWANWDDDRDGIVDGPGELGAAWSDDRCLTGLDRPELQEALRRFGVHDADKLRQVGNGTFVASGTAPSDSSGDPWRRVFVIGDASK